MEELCSSHNYRGSRVFRVATRTFCGIQTLRLLGTREAGGQFPHFDHEWCPLLLRFRDAARPLSFVNTLLGTLLVASGTGTLNRYIELKFDAQMRQYGAAPRRSRLQTGFCPGIRNRVGRGRKRVSAPPAVNPLTSVLAILTLLSYLFVYTPLKRKTPALDSAPFRGRAAHDRLGRRPSGRLSIEAGILFRHSLLAVPTFAWRGGATEQAH